MRAVETGQSQAVGLPLDNSGRKELVDKFQVIWLVIVLEF